MLSLAQALARQIESCLRRQSTGAKDAPLSPRRHPLKIVGQAILELSIVLSLLIVFTALGSNMCIMLAGYGANERACRDAARAAAQATDATSALSFAQAALEGHPSQGTFFERPTLDTGSFLYEDFGGRPPQSVSPFVEVTTSMRMKMPVPALFFGVPMGPGGYITMRNTYRFPIVKVTLYLED